MAAPQNPMRAVIPQQPASPPPFAYVNFSAEIGPQTTEALIAAMSQLAMQRVPEVRLHLSTLGGSVAHGLTIYNQLRAMPFKLVTHNVGSVNSIGNPIFLAGDERYACPHSTFMFHGVGFDFNGAVRLEEKLLKERLEGIIADQERIGAIIQERTNLTGEDVEGLFLEAQTKDAAYAKSVGIVHEIKDAEIPEGSPIVSLVFQRQPV